MAEVELGYPDDEARRQGERCLVCSVNPIFNGDLYILCNGCVDVCPTDCLKLVPLSQVAGDDTLARVVEACLGYPLTADLQGEAPQATAMLFDPARCIRCALCAQRCPTGGHHHGTFHFRGDTAVQ
ncbi:MAG: 4Fe-4S dicluster domain-containing protein [Anaerolineae bacterium]